MKTALKKTVVPELRANGFKGSFPHFKRISGPKTHFLSFQFFSKSQNFYIVVANVSDVDSALVKAWNIPPEKANALHLYEQFRLSFQPRGQEWQYWAELIRTRNPDIFDSIALNVIPWIDQVELWFDHDVAALTEVRRKMEASLSQLVGPQLRAMGFENSFPHFKRLAGSETHFLSFEFYPDGILNFAIFLASVRDVRAATWAGWNIPPEKATALNVSSKYQAHLRPPKGYWFFGPEYFQSKDEKIFKSIALSVIPYLNDAEQWFTKSEESPSCRSLDFDTTLRTHTNRIGLLLPGGANGT